MIQVLFVCSGNTCRSPMAKVILEEKLKAAGPSGTIRVDSAALGSPTDSVANPIARKAITKMYGQDLLANHYPKKINRELLEQADIILVMCSEMKRGLPPNKTWTLKEYAGQSGDISDPFGTDLKTYLRCANELSATIETIIPKLKSISVNDMKNH